MKAFDLARPTSTQQAVDLLAAPATLALAGGQDLLGLMKNGVAQPDRLVSLQPIEALRSIQRTANGELVIGAMATLAQVAENQLVTAHCPVVAEAAAEAASPQIRNLGTVGGNLCQQPRCWYYRAEELHCLRKGGDACLAVVGDNRHHTILSDGPCYAPNLSSLATPLLALGARVTVQGPGGRREFALGELYAAADGNRWGDPNLAAGELLTAVTVPAPGAWRAAHGEVRQKASFDWPIALATVALELVDGQVRAARIVLGGVDVRPHLAEHAAAALVGRPVTAETAAAAGEAAVAGATPLDQTGYKIPICRHLVRRLVLQAAGQGGQ